MALILIMAGVAWLGFALIFVLALMRAASRRIPLEVQTDVDPLRRAKPVGQLKTTSSTVEEAPAVIAELDGSITIPSPIALGAPD